MATLTDPHLRLVRPGTPRTPGGREECLILGSEWVHLRVCLTCGHAGCCDSSPGSAKRVATAVGEGAIAIRLAFERTRRN